jgi:molybdopterin molybdotransferase
MPQEYLTVSEALEMVLAEMQPLGATTVPLEDSLGAVLAEDVVALDPLPPFANSAMDGYAVRAADVAEASEYAPVVLRVVADIAAGSMPDEFVEAGTAARIMTGAPLPAGADAIVPVEDTSEPWRAAERPLPSRIDVRRAVRQGDYVRGAGEDVAVGARVLAAGTYVRPQEVGVMAALGQASVAVVRRPRVAILATGDELVAVGERLAPGKIRNSNGYTQAAQVRETGAVPISLGVAGDSREAVRDRLRAGIEAGIDLFISSAGVSVGAYDVVREVLAAEGNVGFWRVRMRPGKPLAFGRVAGVPYLGLPGNPVSAMVSFERFARTAILKLAGRNQLFRPEVTVVLEEAVESDGRESYLRAVVTRREGSYFARTTGGQGSHIMTSLTMANALVIVPEDVRFVAAGERLPAMMIDWPETVF